MTAPKWHGLLLLNKRSGVSSFDSLYSVKRAFDTGKAGHTGTLDKFASGLLLVLVGRGVKLAPLFSHCSKEYTANVIFGKETSTLDPEGEVIGEARIPSREEVENVLESFQGNILQAPPAYSAIHINGRRAHELVREGKEPEMKKRPVTVHELEIVSWSPPEAVIHALVSSGTYIRSLARDIALAAGSRAYLGALKRTRVGAFHLEDAVDSQPSYKNGANNNGDDIKIADKSGVDSEIFRQALRPLDRELFKALSIPYFHIDDKASELFLNGRALDTFLKSHIDALPATSFESENDSVHSNDTMAAAGVFRESDPDRLLGILEYRNEKWSYGHVFANN